MNSWIINQNDFESTDKAFFESIFSLGNGYMGVRGFDEEEIMGSNKEFNTYIAGIFDYYTPGKTDMVNTPNFWRTSIYINDELFSLSKGEVLESGKELNMKDGTLKRRIVWRNSQGDDTLIETTRVLCINSCHQAILNIQVCPLNYSGEIVIETGIDTDVWNKIIDDDQMKSSTNVCRFLQGDGETIHSEDGIHIVKLKTIESGFKIYEGYTTEVLQNGHEIAANHITIDSDKLVADKAVIPVIKGNVYTLNKYINVWTSRDKYDESLENQVLEAIKETKNTGYSAVIKRHIEAWNKKWEISDIEIVGDDRSQRALRYNIFQLIQTNAENDEHVNIGARGIMHGRYKGCYFWDTEIFMLPFYIYTNPIAAKNLLLYRYHTLKGAEENARNQNLDGARYAWMSALDGLDQCDTWDIGLSEVHITADVAYAINHYFEATNDIEFIKDFGLEMLIQTARYWKSRFTYDSSNDCYNLLFVKGPNEYGGVINNNLYTVMMASNNMILAEKYIAIIKSEFPDIYNELIKKLNFREEEILIWGEIIQKAVINYDAKKSLYFEDDNFLKLEPLDIDKIKNEDIPLYKKICFDRLQRYRVLKQADVILLMLLCPQKFTMEEKLAAWYFYEPITVHDSSLSYGTHAAFAAKLNLLDEAYKYFIKSVCLDMDNVMENVQKEGIHFAALGASWQATVNGFAGIELNDGILNINPHLPSNWEKISFRFYYHNCLLRLSITHGSIYAAYEKGNNNSIKIKVSHKDVTLTKGEEQLVSQYSEEEYYGV